MNICKLDGCENLTKRKQSIFCSISCASTFNQSKVKGRTQHKKLCVGCSKEFLTVDRIRIYCSRSCSARINNSKYQKRPKSTKYKECLWCYDKVYAKEFCNVSCRNKWEVFEWLAGRLDGNASYDVRSFVRKYISVRSKGRCEGIDSRTTERCLEDRVVELDHIDGNPFNSVAENLRHLCPTCHTLTSTYGSKNKGSGRTWKSAYSQFKPKTSLDKQV